MICRHGVSVTWRERSATLSATASSNLSVTFSSQSASVCTVSGSTVNYLAAGTCAVRASQAGNANYNPAPDADRTITIGAAANTTTLASSANPSPFGQPVTFTTTVVGQNPTGTVAFGADGNPLAGCASAALTGAGSSKTAACTTATLAGGTHPITAAYSADSRRVDELLRTTAAAHPAVINKPGRAPWRNAIQRREDCCRSRSQSVTRFP